MKKEMKALVRVLVPAVVILSCFSGCTADEGKKYEIPTAKQTVTEKETEKKEKETEKKEKETKKTEKETTVTEKETTVTESETEITTAVSEPDNGGSGFKFNKDGGTTAATEETTTAATEETTAAKPDMTKVTGDIEDLTMLVTEVTTYDDWSVLEYEFFNSLEVPVWLDEYTATINDVDVTDATILYIAAESGATQKNTMSFDDIILEDGDVITISGMLKETNDYTEIEKISVDLCI